MLSEADTCRKFVLPKLYAAGWTDDQICEQRFFTPGRIVVHGNSATRRIGKRADYLLRYTRDIVLAVVEAKASYKNPADGLHQAKDYAQILGLKWAYSTNGHGIVEFDFTTGKETEFTDFPSPSELWGMSALNSKIDYRCDCRAVLDAVQSHDGQGTALLPRDRH